MEYSFAIPESAYDDFLAILEIDPEKLESLVKQISSNELTLELEEYTENLAVTHDIPVTLIARAVYNVFSPLTTLRAESGLPPAEFTRGLEDLLRQQNASWYQEYGQKWQRAAKIIEPLLAADGFFAILNKTARLMTNHAILARGFKILTDVRPVFDDNVTAVKALLLSSTLVVDFEESGVSKRLHLTVDQSDLALLREQLERAEKKVQIFDELANGLGVPVLIAGAE